MYVLKDSKCQICNGEIEVFAYTGQDEYGKTITVVDHGQCSCCGKIVILPQDDFREFIYKHCRRIV